MYSAYKYLNILYTVLTLTNIVIKHHLKFNKIFNDHTIIYHVQYKVNQYNPKTILRAFADPLHYHCLHDYYYLYRVH